MKEASGELVRRSAQLASAGILHQTSGAGFGRPSSLVLLSPATKHVPNIPVDVHLYLGTIRINDMMDSFTTRFW